MCVPCLVFLLDVNASKVCVGIVEELEVCRRLVECYSWCDIVDLVGRSDAYCTLPLHHMVPRVP